MISCSVNCTPESSQQISSQQSRPSLSNAEKAVKYGTYGVFAFGLGFVTVMVIDEIQSHLNQPARDFVTDYCFANVTTVAAYNARNTYSKLLLKDQQASYLFAKAAISGSIMLVSNILYKLGERLFDSSFIPSSDTVNQPEHRPSAVEPTNRNEQSAIV